MYDNFNFKDTRRDEIVGHTATMRAMTTAALIICPSLPSSGLLQSMHNPTIPLSLHDIYRSPGISGDGTNLTSRISRFFIYEAIRYVHRAAVDEVFKTTSAPEMPIIDKLPATQTKYRQFRAVYEDEGTITGTYHVHDQLFNRQLKRSGGPDTGLQSTENKFATRLWLNVRPLVVKESALRC